MKKAKIMNSDNSFAEPGPENTIVNITGNMNDPFPGKYQRQTIANPPEKPLTGKWKSIDPYGNFFLQTPIEFIKKIFNAKRRIKRPSEYQPDLTSHFYLLKTGPGNRAVYIC
jgi:hypothetical protein